MMTFENCDNPFVYVFCNILPSNRQAMSHYQVGGAAVSSAVQRNDSVRTEASFKLLEENLSLLDRLRAKGEIVK